MTSDWTAADRLHELAVDILAWRKWVEEYGLDGSSLLDELRLAHDRGIEASWPVWTVARTMISPCSSS